MAVTTCAGCTVSASVDGGMDGYARASARQTKVYMSYWLQNTLSDFGKLPTLLSKAIIGGSVRGMHHSSRRLSHFAPLHLITRF